MDLDRALVVLKALGDGVNPYTGEVFPMDSAYQHPETVRALFQAITALEKEKAKEDRKKSLPERSGTAWTDDEDQQLIDAYEAGQSLQELVMKHQRTQGAITSRLMKLGKLEFGSETSETKPEE